MDNINQEKNSHYSVQKATKDALLTSIELENLQKVIGKFSINQLISILIHHDVNIEDINFVPLFLVSSSGTTIQGIFIQDNKLYIQINIFQIKVFSKLEKIFETNDHYENQNYINALRLGIQKLLPIQIFGNNDLISHVQKPFYNLVHGLTINKLTHYIYQELREDYSVIVEYENVINEISLKPNLVGKSYIDNIFIGATTVADFYIISIKVVLSFDQDIEEITQRIRGRIAFILEKAKNIHLEVKISASSTEKSDKKKLNYIGDYHL